MMLKCFLKHELNSKQPSVASLTLFCQSNNKFYIGLDSKLLILTCGRIYEQQLGFIINCAIIISKGELLLLGLSNGELVCLDNSSFAIVWSIPIKDELPIRKLLIFHNVLLILVGKNTLVMLYLDSLIAASTGNELIVHDLAESACLVELPMGQVNDLKVLSKYRPWPNSYVKDEFYGPKILLVGNNPMLSIINLPAIEEAIRDPLGMATQFIGKKLSSWLSSSGKESPRHHYLLDIIPRAMTKPLIILDDSSRTLNSILPTAEGLVLIDSQHGRALIFHPQIGTFTRQFKGFRGAYIVTCKRSLLALYPKRNHLQIIPLTRYAHIQTIDIPKANHFYCMDNDDGLDPILLTIDDCQLKLYKLSSS